MPQQISTSLEMGTAATVIVSILGFVILLLLGTLIYLDTMKDEAVDNVTVGVLTILSEDDPEQPVSTAIILEGGIVMDKIWDLPQAVCLIFGLTYALNLDYPEYIGNTFTFIQSGLGTKHSP